MMQTTWNQSLIMQKLMNKQEHSRVNPARLFTGDKQQWDRQDAAPGAPSWLSNGKKVEPG